MPQSVNGFSLAPSPSLPLSLSLSFCHTLSLCNFYYYLHLVMRCAYVCFCVSVRVIFMSIAISCTHTHTYTRFLGVFTHTHRHTVCNFGASILIDCQTSIWGNKREEFKALLTYVNRGLCAELKFIQRAANYLENFDKRGTAV